LQVYLIPTSDSKELIGLVIEVSIGRRRQVFHGRSQRIVVVVPPLEQLVVITALEMARHWGRGGQKRLAAICRRWRLFIIAIFFRRWTAGRLCNDG
jgi:hypothetical protein